MCIRDRREGGGVGGNGEGLNGDGDGGRGRSLEVGVAGVQRDDLMRSGSKVRGEEGAGSEAEIVLEHGVADGDGSIFKCDRAGGNDRGDVYKRQRWTFMRRQPMGIWRS